MGQSLFFNNAPFKKFFHLHKIMTVALEWQRYIAATSLEFKPLPAETLTRRNPYPSVETQCLPGSPGVH